MFADVGSGHRDRDRRRGLLHAVHHRPAAAAAVGRAGNPPLLLLLSHLLLALRALMVLLVMLNRRRHRGGGGRGRRQLWRGVHVGELGAEVGGRAREDPGQGAAEGFCIAGLVAVGRI